MRTKIRRLAVAVVAAVGSVLCVDAVRADTLYATTFLDNQLVSVDPTTGAGMLVGALSPPMAPFGLANNGSGLLTFDSNADVIRQLDPATGGTLATFNIGIGPVLGQGGLAFQSHDVGFLTSALDPTTFNPVNDLFRFNISTGTSTLVGHTAPTLEALAFDSKGDLFGLGKLDGNLYLVDPTNAGTTLVGNVGISIGSPSGGLTFGPGGTLYATLDDKLYTLDTSTGAATAVGASDPTATIGFSSISGLAFAGPQAATPEPSSLLLLASGVAILGFYGRRRRVHRPGA